MTRIATGALVLFTGLYLYYAVALGAEVRTNLLPFVLVPAGAALVVAFGGRWAAPVGFLLAGASLDAIAPELSFHLSRPDELEGMVWATLTIASLGVATVAGALTALPDTMRIPALVPVAAGVALAAVGAGVVVTLDDQSPLEDEVGTARLQSAPRVIAEDFRYRTTLRSVRVGNEATLVLENTGGAVHDLVIDELDVARTAPSGRTTVVRFTPRERGTVLYYCSIRDHRKQGMVGRLEVR